MRLLGGISCAVLCSSLIGCLPTVAETVEINGKSYRTGFYGDCYLMDDLPLSGLEYELDEITYRALQHPEFDLWYNGSDSVMYCAEDQWEAAKTYYADDQQYLYYCSVGVTIKETTIDFLSGEQRRLFLLLSGKSFLCGGRATVSDLSISTKGMDCNACSGSIV